MAEIKIRTARANDQAAIAAFTQNTFRWGDYIADVWQNWLDDRHGNLLVAEVDGTVVGTLHVALFGNHEAWTEGMRVHPEFRRLGVAAQLDAAGREWARRAGCRVVRLETAGDNFTAQAALERFGYRRVMRLSEWQASASTGEVGQIRPARPRDLDALLALWEHSQMRRAAHRLMPIAEGWRWAEFTRARLRAWLAHGWAWVTPVNGTARGFALAREYSNELNIELVVGSAQELRTLLSEFRYLAKARQSEKIWLSLPSDQRIETAVRESGFVPEGDGMLVYEAKL